MGNGRSALSNLERIYILNARLSSLLAQCNTGILEQCTRSRDFAACLTAGVVSMQETDQEVNAQFDNKFYQRLTEGYGVLTSDVVLFRDPRTQGLVQQFADVS
jgi:hypothetical protein